MGIFSTVFTKKGPYIDTTRIVVKISNMYFTKVNGVKEPQDWTKKDHIELHSYIVNYRYDHNVLPDKESYRQELLRNISSNQSGGLVKLIYGILIIERASLRLSAVEGLGVITSELEALGVPNHLINGINF